MRLSEGPAYEALSDSTTPTKGKSGPQMALSCSNLRTLSEFSYLAIQGVDNMPSEEPDTSLCLLVPSET